jgi:hypothetical protein
VKNLEQAHAQILLDDIQIYSGALQEMKKKIQKLASKRETEL